MLMYSKKCRGTVQVLCGTIIVPGSTGNVSLRTPMLYNILYIYTLYTVRRLGTRNDLKGTPTLHRPSTILQCLYTIAAYRLLVKERLV